MKRKARRGISAAVLMLSLAGLGLVAQASTVGAQATPPDVSVYQHSRRISMGSDALGHCEWELPDVTSITLSYGQQFTGHHTEWGCTNPNITRYIAIIRASTRYDYIDEGTSDGVLSVTHIFEISRLNRDTGNEILCGTYHYRSGVHGRYNQGTTYRMGTLSTPRVAFDGCGIGFDYSVWELGLAHVDG